MAKKTYDNRTINVFPEELKITLPDGYRMDIEYDEDGEQIVNLRGGFSFNDEGEETFEFSAASKYWAAESNNGANSDLTVSSSAKTPSAYLERIYIVE